MTRHAGSGISRAVPNTVATTGFGAMQEMIKVSAKGGGLKLPKPFTMGTSVVLSNCVYQQILTWHRHCLRQGSS